MPLATLGPVGRRARPLWSVGRAAPPSQNHRQTGLRNKMLPAAGLMFRRYGVILTVVAVSLTAELKTLIKWADRAGSSRKSRASRIFCVVCRATANVYGIASRSCV